METNRWKKFHRLNPATKQARPFAALTPPPNMSFRQIAAALKISVSTAHKLSRSGMPTDSIEAAQAWIRDRAKSVPTASDTATLAAKRGRKLDLECQLLALRLERESSNAEFLPVPEVIEGVANFMRFAHLAMRMRCDLFADRLAACATPQEAVKALREFADESWATGAVGMAAQTQSTRMGRAIADLILERFPKASDAHLQSWAKSLGFDLGELTKTPE